MESFHEFFVFQFALVKPGIKVLNGWRWEVEVGGGVGGGGGGWRWEVEVEGGVGGGGGKWRWGVEWEVEVGGGGGRWRVEREVEVGGGGEGEKKGRDRGESKRDNRHID